MDDVKSFLSFSLNSPAQGKSLVAGSSPYPITDSAGLIQMAETALHIDLRSFNINIALA